MIATLLLAAGFAFTDDAAAGRLHLTDGGKPVLTYNYGMQLPAGVPESRKRSSYLHPLYAPDGTVLTDDFPKDHYHHRGLSWMWPVVLVEGKKLNLWEIAGIRQRFIRWVGREAGAERARLAIENGWYLDDDRQVVGESVEIVVQPARDGRRVLELVLRFKALGAPVAIAGTSDQRKGYGGLSLRFAPRNDTVLTTDAGREAGDTNLVRHPWAELTGVFQGRRAGIRIEDDPANPAFPNGWCLRYYGLLGVNFPGLEPYRLEPERPLGLKYRVTLFSE
jgi:hypothetical protein